MPRAARIIPLLAALLALAGCGSHATAPKPAAVDPAPSASSPAGVVKRFEYCWNNLDDSRYPGLFTEDFVLLPASGDSSAHSAPQPWGRDPELLSAAHMFVGDATHVPAHSATLSFDKTLIDQTDFAPGWTNRWHRFIRTQLDANVSIDEGGGVLSTSEIRGFLAFHLVRGDSAQIPPALIAQGVKPDSSRWYVEMIEDETLPSSGLHALPARLLSWLWLRCQFL